MHPKSFVSYENVGLVYVEAKDVKNALKFFNKAIELNPQAHESWNNAGALYYESKQTDKALHYLLKAVELNPKQVHALKRLGNLFFHKKKFSYALKYFKKAFNASNGKEFGAAYNVATIFFDRNDWKEALKWNKRSLKANPKGYQSHLLQGLIILLSNCEKCNEKAIACFKKSLELYPSAQALFNLARLYYNMKDYKKAIKTSKECVKINPNYGPAYNNCALSFKGLKDFDNSIKWFKMGIKIDPNYTLFYHNLGNVYLDDIGNKSEAFECFKRALECDNNFDEARYILGGMYFECQDYEKAIQFFLTMHEKHPRYVDGLVMGGKSCFLFNEQYHKNALEYYNKAISIKSDCIDAHYELGILYLSKGKLDLSLRCFEKITREINPTHEEALEMVKKVKEMKVNLKVDSQVKEDGEVKKKDDNQKE